MRKIKRFISKLSKSQKITCVFLLFSFVLLLAITIPTFSRFKNRNITINSVWDGSVATAYNKGSGTKNDPYVISNGAELAYFSLQLQTDDYNNTYFVLKNDIVLNNGIFEYDPDYGIKYILNGNTYYVDYYSNKYYNNINKTGTEVGTLNIFNSLDNFKGYFDGNFFRIYGAYITDVNKDEIALFTNLNGNVENLYVENAMMYGGVVTSGIASKATNTTLKNVLFNGYVVGKNSELTRSVDSDVTIPIINVETTSNIINVDLNNRIPFIGSEIISTSITGNYVINNSSELETSITINGVSVSGGSFNIDLGNNILESINISTETTSLDEVTVEFSNVKYNVVRKYAVSSGIVGVSNNIIMNNIVNKGYVYGYSNSGGLAGVLSGSSNINQSYNKGSINSEYNSGGLIGVIEKSNNNVTISKSYNSGSISSSNNGGFISRINNNTGNISISNSFNVSENTCINNISSSTVSVSNSYYTYGNTPVSNGSITGSFTKTTNNNLNDKTFVINNLLFDEFVDFDDLDLNSDNVWIYEKNLLPLLFIDDISRAIANIHVSTYSWNNLSYDLNTIRLSSNIAFSIEEINPINPIKEQYYYVSNSNIPLTNEEILEIDSWTQYTNIVQITEEGNYIIYAKIVDSDDDVTYLNTDVLVLDLPGVSASISMDDNSWTSLNDNLSNIYIDRSKKLYVNIDDTISKVISKKYYISEEILDVSALNSIDENDWNIYSNDINIDDVGNYIVYVKIVDDYDHNTYINSGRIVFNGYNQNKLIIGRNESSYQNMGNYITDKSSVTFNITYLDNNSYLSGYTHNIISNILLPIGTKINIIDHVMNKVYEYKITTSEDIYNYNDSCDSLDTECVRVATYPFTLFKEIGSIDKMYVENSYYINGKTEENFEIVLDLSSTNIIGNYEDITIYMELHDSNGNNVRPTLYDTIKTVNIYSNVNDQNVKASLYLSANYNGNPIMYNDNLQTNINISSGLTYKKFNGLDIIDTTFEDKEMGLSLKMVDSLGNIVDREYLKSIIFKIGDNVYYPSSDNKVRINLNSGSSNTNKVLTIITNENNSGLEEGTYYFKISNYISNDGYYYTELGKDEISIPVVVAGNDNKIVYGFDVIMSNENHIINKINKEVNISFNILQNGNFANPNIRVSLYKKDVLSAYNQDYSIVDLSDYVTNELNMYTDNVYYVSTNPKKYNGNPNTYNNFNLNLITSNFANTGYKFVFSLYSGTKKIGVIEKYFIVTGK